MNPVSEHWVLGYKEKAGPLTETDTQPSGETNSTKYLRKYNGHIVKVTIDLNRSLLLTH